MTLTAEGDPSELRRGMGSMPASSRRALDRAVEDLSAGRERWVAFPIAERIGLLEEMIARFASLARRWVSLELAAKGAGGDLHAVGFEWMVGPFVILRTLRRWQQVLADIEACGHPRIPGPVHTRPNGQVVARVFPRTPYDRALLFRHTVEVWMEPGLSAAELPGTQALAYREGQQAGRVALVLGGGNLSGIGPTDALDKLFVENQVVLLKVNPVNDYLGPLIEEGFRPLVERGFLRVVYGGAEEGSHLCHHPGVDEIHLTGTDATLDAVVFGPGVEGARRKAERRPLLDKRISAELGNVGPAIVVPGRWSPGDLDYHAELLASDLGENAGFTCSASRVILLHSEWEQRDDLLNRLRKALCRVPPRVAYYPGARDRYQAFLSAHPEAESLGAARDGELPWTLVPGVDPNRAGEICFSTEPFCSLFAEVSLTAPTVAQFVDRAVEFANTRLRGTLGALLLHRAGSPKDPEVASSVDRAIANLRYGLVGVNTPVGVTWVEGSTPWGGFPGHGPYDAQSGTGFVHNSLMFSRAQKTVVRAPFRLRPRPPWFVSRGRAFSRVAPKLAAYEASPSWWKLPGILWSVLGG